MCSLPPSLSRSTPPAERRLSLLGSGGSRHTLTAVCRLRFASNYATQFTKRLVRMHHTAPSFPQSREQKRNIMLTITSPHAWSPPQQQVPPPRPLAQRNSRSSPAARRLQL